MRKAQRLCAIRGTVLPPLPYKYTGSALVMLRYVPKVS